jgi:hypothetical protein
MNLRWFLLFSQSINTNRNPNTIKILELYVGSLLIDETTVAVEDILFT